MHGKTGAGLASHAVDEAIRAARPHRETSHCGGRSIPVIHSSESLAALRKPRARSMRVGLSAMTFAIQNRGFMAAGVLVPDHYGSADSHAARLPSSVASRLVEEFGGPGEIRTHDLFHAMEARSQLRHRPIVLDGCLSLYHTRVHWTELTRRLTGWLQ